MKSAWSLRARLTAIILLPLLLIAVVIGVWAVRDAQSRADQRFNRALLSAALAISRDVAVSEGDALSPETNALLRGTTRGQVFYHVVAPDGVFVTGYATPPVPNQDSFDAVDGQVFFNGVHQSRTVRAVRFVDTMQLDGLSGEFNVTVWQDVRRLRDLVREFSLRSLAVMASLILGVALIVWFGVRIGLRPLLDLEAAIARRSSDELSPIQRAVPHEVDGVVTTLNTLFAQLQRSMTAQSEFISNAAHQLRNPIAAVLSLAEAVRNAPSGEVAKTRAVDLLASARAAAELRQKLLLLERAKSSSPASEREVVDLDLALSEWVEAYREGRDGTGAAILLDHAGDIGPLNCDATMLREALRNLLDNAFQHGGPDLSEVKVSARRQAQGITISVSDNGIGVPAEHLGTAKERFRRLAETSTSGLGLSIAEAFAESHGGSLALHPLAPGLEVRMSLPI